MFEQFLPKVIDKLNSRDYFVLMKFAIDGGNLQHVNIIIDLSQQSPSGLSKRDYQILSKAAKNRGRGEIEQRLQEYI